jgi:hypothetical protein
MLARLTTRKTQVGKKPVLNVNARSGWLDPECHALLQSSLLPLSSQIPNAHSEEVRHRSLAPRGLRVQRRYGIPAGEWSRRWGM